MWVHAVAARYESRLGGVGPRATPTIHGGRVYALGSTGVLRCLDGGTGAEIWIKDVLADFGLTPETDLTNIPWGRSGSPLVVDDLVVVAAGGLPPEGPFVSLVAYRQEDGKQVWQGGKTQVSYASPNVFTLGGKRQILIVNESTVSGHDVKTGRVLWEFDWPGTSYQDASAAQAIAVDDEHVFVSKHYSMGSALYRVTRNVENTWFTAQKWNEPTRMKTKFTNVVIHQGYVYGLSDGILECIELRTGKRQWKKPRYGQGQVLRVDSLLLVQAETGEVALVELNPDKPIELGRIPALAAKEQTKTWNNLCLYGKHLLVRNDREAICYELAVKPSDD
jgi:outer membrane protein assembly factor BamB